MLTKIQRNPGHTNNYNWHEKLKYEINKANMKKYVRGRLKRFRLR